MHQFQESWKSNIRMLQNDTKTESMCVAVDGCIPMGYKVMYKALCSDDTNRHEPSDEEKFKSTQKITHCENVKYVKRKTSFIQLFFLGKVKKGAESFFFEKTIL